MGATWRAGPRQRELSRAANCAGEFVRRGVCWVASESIIRTNVLAESAGIGKTRGGYGANARLAVAKCAMERRLHLQGCACRHGRGARITLSAFVRHSVVESRHCPRRFGRKLFGRAVSAVGFGAITVTRKVVGPENRSRAGASKE